MHCDILTIFPSLFASVLNQSILLKAQEKGLFSYQVHNIRDYTKDKHRQVDDAPYGGGPGMVFKPEPVFAAVEAVLAQRPVERIILLSPQGELFDQKKAKDLAACANLLLICGRYEGVDERVAQHLATEEISIGDYVLNGGELPALILLEAAVRLIPGVLGDDQSAAEDSFYHGLLDYPHYTRPANFRGMEVPQVLMGGNHEQIQLFRRYQALKRTWLRRPELLGKCLLNEEDREMLARIQGENK
ncbi:MAG: tRNA (guanosine(37)-N1)-methyltransferase TrmD [Candidatus Schekmanbacteria bacterium]|nr:tRNA (guanosine(37)-N1)-methyltransferase TrmD [Candidatus Schekmanbacteria bacterium]